MGMAHVVEADTRDTDPAHVTTEGLGEACGQPRRAVIGGEDEVAVIPSGASPEPDLELAFAVRAERRCGAGVDMNGPSGRLGLLPVGELVTVLALDDRLTDGQVVRGEVHLRPPQAAQL